MNPVLAAPGEATTSTLPGRDLELALLLEMFEDGGSDVASVHGIGGVGKTSLMAQFAMASRDGGARVVELDCRRVRPTPIGFLAALGAELGLAASDAEGDLKAALRELAGSRGDLVVILDHYEVLPLLDTWIRQHLVAVLVPGAKLVLAGREPLHPAWRSVSLGGIEMMSIELDCLDPSTSRTVLTGAGVGSEYLDRLVAMTRGHPLSIWIAVDALARHPGVVPERLVGSRLASDLAKVHLDGLDETTRDGIEALGVVRRGTLRLLGAMLPGHAPGDVIARLERLPFVERRPDGLAVHDAVRVAITHRLEADDPVRHGELRRRAWKQIRLEFKQDPTPDTWRYTADLLFLIENPLLRDGFFPTQSGEFSIQDGDPDHLDVVAEMIEREGGEQRTLYREWLTLCPGAWKVALNPSGNVAGCALVIEATELPASLRRNDPVVDAFESDRRSDALPAGQLVLYLRTWISPGLGELPSAAQAALWLDCKRIYLDHRHTMRRIYTAVEHPDIFLPVLAPLGFEAIDIIDRQHILRVDFGPGGVNDWLSEIASRELGIETPQRLDPETRTITIDDEDITLTPLEFGVIAELDAAAGKPVSRADLIAQVWGHTYNGGSNVVDAVIRTLRRRLGVHATNIETVRGIGYRYRPT